MTPMIMAYTKMTLLIGSTDILNIILHNKDYSEKSSQNALDKTEADN